MKLYKRQVKGKSAVPWSNYKCIGETGAPLGPHSPPPGPSVETAAPQPMQNSAPPRKLPTAGVVLPPIGRRGAQQ